MTIAPFNPQLLVPDFSFIQRSISIAPMTPTGGTLVGMNVNRIAFFYINQTPNAGFINALTVRSNGGFPAPVSAASQVFHFKDFGPLVGQEWFIASPTLAMVGTVVEIIYTPNRGPS